MVIRFMLGVALCAFAPVSESHAKTKRLCANEVCAWITTLQRDRLGAEILSFPGRKAWVNMRCNNGFQVDSRRDTYIYHAYLLSSGVICL
jgi:hypothetical protein